MLDDFEKLPRSTWPRFYSRYRHSSFLERTRELLSKSFQYTHTYVLCIHKHTGAPVRGRRGRAILLVTKVIRKAARERKRTKRAILFRSGDTLRLIRISYVRCDATLLFSPVVVSSTNLRRSAPTHPHTRTGTRTQICPTCAIRSI